nr:hypothetical protein [Tanacetum cinerariifolium]
AGSGRHGARYWHKGGRGHLHQQVVAGALARRPPVKAQLDNRLPGRQRHIAVEVHGRGRSETVAVGKAKVVADEGRLGTGAGWPVGIR